MLKIMLVDDEINVVEGLKVSIPWKEYGYMVVAEATNGGEAFEKALLQQPDIIITDITMPVMDGITMAQKVKKQKPDTKIIFLTCHDDFDYAREAVRLEASEYLVKETLRREELIQVLIKLKKEIEEKRVYRDKVEQISKQFSENQYVIGKSIINKLLGDNFLPQADISRRLLQANYSFPDEKYILSVVTLDQCLQFIEDGYEQCNTRAFEFLVMDIIQNILKEKKIGTVFLKDRNIFIIIYNYTPKLNINIFDTINVISRKIQIDIQKVIQTTATVYISRQFDDIGELKKIYEDVKALNNQRFYMRNEVILFHNYHAHKEQEKCDYLKNIIEEYKSAFISLEINQVEYVATTLVEQASILKTDVKEIKHAVEKIFLAIIDVLEKYGLSVESFLDKHYTDIIHDINSIFDVKQVVLKYSKSAIDVLKKNTVFLGNYEVEKVIDYVDKNFKEDITLDFMAQYVNMNSSYFSRYFKNKTGENFINYLKGVRLEKAKELLITTDYTLEEIANAIGYTSITYVAKLFKKTMGLSPGAYRKKYRNIK